MKQMSLRSYPHTGEFWLDVPIGIGGSFVEQDVGKRDWMMWVIAYVCSHSS